MTSQPECQLVDKARSVLMDRFGRVHRSLRISVTDICNLRCQYCMPSEGVEFLPRDTQLSFKQIAQFAQIASNLGIRKVRLTGGEPLMRPHLWELVELLSTISAIEEVGLTTNGFFLVDQIPKLVKAGLKRVNISLDTLSEETFKKLARRDGLDRVLHAIDASLAFPELTLRLNALVLRDVNLVDVLKLVAFAVDRNITIRFIEFMPLDASRAWSASRMVSGEELRQMIASEYGPLVEDRSDETSQPSTDYRISAGGKVGFIDTVSLPFCERCDRLRLSSDGKIRNCLFGSEEWDIGSLLHDQCNQQFVAQTLERAVMAKHASHGIASSGFAPPVRAMYQIGG